MIVLSEPTRGLVIRHPNHAQRLLARVRAGSLDRRLAAGAAPESGPLLAIRAYAIVLPAARGSVARSLQRTMDRAARPRPHHSASTCRNVRAAADALGRLVERLRSPCPVSARGMAMVNVLLTDGAGPLYYPSRPGELATSVHEALAALDGPVVY